MLLQDILEEADLYVPNALSQTQKIRYINEVQRKLYRSFPLELNTYFFYTIPGTASYVLPSNCSEENIKSVFVDGKEYYYRTQEDRVSSGHVYVLGGGEIILGITPTSETEGYVNYDATPIDLTVDDLASEPPFLSDYHELLVLGLAEKLAMVSKDFQTAQQYAARFTQLEKNAVDSIKRVKIKKIRVVRGWR